MKPVPYFQITAITMLAHMAQTLTILLGVSPKTELKDIARKQRAHYTGGSLLRLSFKSFVFPEKMKIGVSKSVILPVIV
jgi:hypothetical protein